MKDMTKYVSFYLKNSDLKCKCAYQNKTDAKNKECHNNTNQVQVFHGATFGPSQVPNFQIPWSITKTPRTPTPIPHNLGDMPKPSVGW